MIDGDNRSKASNSKNYNAGHEQVHSKQPPQSNPSKITIATDTDGSKVSFIQKILNFIENFLHIKIFNRKIEVSDTSNCMRTIDTSEKNHFEFDITNNIDIIETPMDYIQANNKLTIYNNLQSIVRYFSDFIDNYSTIGAINQDTAIEFLRSKTNDIKANIILLDKRGNSHNIIPPDVDYLRSLNKVELKTAIIQVNQELKKFIDTSFESRGYDSHTEMSRLAEALKSPALLKDIQSKDSLLLHVLDKQELIIGIPNGNIKVAYDVIASDSHDNTEDIDNEFINNNKSVNNIAINSLDVNSTDVNNEYKYEDDGYEYDEYEDDEYEDDGYEYEDDTYGDILKRARKLSGKIQNKQVEYDTNLQPLPDQEHDVEGIPPEILAIIHNNRNYYTLTYEIYL
jgi:hypothetical protein